MEEPDDTRFVRFARAAEGIFVEYGPTVSVAIAGIGWTFCKDFITEPPTGETWWHWAARVASASALSALGIIGAMLAYKRSGAIRALKADKVRLETALDRSEQQIVALVRNGSEAWRLKLYRMFVDMQLHNTFRISIYRYSEELRKFSMLGRYAAIPHLNQVGRGIYPAEAGCIGRAWTSPEGEACAYDLPADENAFVAANKIDWGLTEDEARNLKMKSRSVYAFSLMDALNINRTAVIVFESTMPNAADVGTLRTAVNETYRADILSDLSSLRFIEPSPVLAQAAGF